MSALEVVWVVDGVGIGARSANKSLSLLSSSLLLLLLLLLKTVCFACLHIGNVKFVVIAVAELS